MDTYSSPIPRASSSACRRSSIRLLPSAGAEAASPVTVGSASSASPPSLRTRSGSAPALRRTGTTIPPSCSSSAASRWWGTTSGLRRAPASRCAAARASWDLMVKRSACIKPKSVYRRFAVMTRRSRARYARLHGRDLPPDPARVGDPPQPLPRSPRGRGLVGRARLRTAASFPPGSGRVASRCSRASSAPWSTAWSGSSGPATRCRCRAAPCTRCGTRATASPEPHGRPGPPAAPSSGGRRSTTSAAATRRDGLASPAPPGSPPC